VDTRHGAIRGLAVYYNLLEKRWNMTLEEFETATEQELRQKANECFAKSVNAGTGDKPYLYLEAQFYISEIQRREHERERLEDTHIARRDFWLEVAVIGLILVEIILSICGIILAINQGKDEDTMMQKQNAILGNLETSTQATADQLKQELALQYEVFINAQYDGSRGMALFNNSKSEIYLYGIKVSKNPARQNPGGPASIAEHTAGSIRLEEYYPHLFDAVPQTGSMVLPFALYVKNAAGKEHMVKGQMKLTRQGSGIAGTTESNVSAEQWSQTVNLLPIP
jgi:hypothetical protein